MTATPVEPMVPLATETISPSATVESATPTPSPTPGGSRLARIVAPAINLDVPVVPVGWTLVEKQGQIQSVWDTASYAAGHHINSALPGQGGNIVLSGHNNIEGEVFRYVVDLEVGDRVSLVTEDGRRFVYRVVEKNILPETGASAEQRAANAQYIEPNYDEERLTLVTCWPYWSNTHRVIVIATPDAP